MMGSTVSGWKLMGNSLQKCPKDEKVGIIGGLSNVAKQYVDSHTSLLQRSAVVPEESCTASNERDAMADTHQHDLVWICQSGDWKPYK